MLTQSELMEIEISIYRKSLQDYNRAIAENPALEIFLARPKPPTIYHARRWNMSKVVTNRARRWKRNVR